MSKAVSMDISEFSEQAEIFSKYLIGKMPKEHHIERYVDIISAQEGFASNAHDSFLIFALKYPYTIPYLDAYLAFRHPYGELRYRILVMFAVLEGSPDFWQDFLPEKKSVLYIFRIVIIGMRAAIRLGIGMILTRFVKSQS